MSDSIFILNPSSAGQCKDQQVRRALDGLKGKVVGFVDNSKPNFNNLVDDMAEFLLNHHGVSKVIKHRKTLASIPAPADVMSDLERQCDLVITGSGD